MKAYEQIKVLGEGGFAKALLVKRKSDNLLCVAKSVKLSGLSEKEKKEAISEVKVLSALKHPNIVRYIESFTESGFLYIVMEYADGGDLSQKIEKNGRKAFNEDEVLKIFTQLALAIKYIHDRKILHRDLKGQNVFLMKDGTVKLGDFGIAKVLDHTMQFCNTQIGTPYYLSPEMCQGKNYNSKTDIWSFGCIMYEMCTLHHAFEGRNINNLLFNIVRGHISPISSQYSNDLRNLINSMLNKDPNQRPTANQIVMNPIIKNRLTMYLSEFHLNKEMSHTVLHGMNPLKQDLNFEEPPKPIQEEIPQKIDQKEIEIENKKKQEEIQRKYKEIEAKEEAERQRQERRNKPMTETAKARQEDSRQAALEREERYRQKMAKFANKDKNDYNKIQPQNQINKRISPQNDYNKVPQNEINRRVSPQNDINRIQQQNQINKRVSPQNDYNKIPQNEVNRRVSPQNEVNKKQAAYDDYMQKYHPANVANKKPSPSYEPQYNQNNLRSPNKQAQAQQNQRHYSPEPQGYEYQHERPMNAAERKRLELIKAQEENARMAREKREREELEKQRELEMEREAELQREQIYQRNMNMNKNKNINVRKEQVRHQYDPVEEQRKRIEQEKAEEDRKRKERIEYEKERIRMRKDFEDKERQKQAELAKAQDAARQAWIAAQEEAKRLKKEANDRKRREAEEYSKRVELEKQQRERERLLRQQQEKAQEEAYMKMQIQYQEQQEERERKMREQKLQEARDREAEQERLRKKLEEDEQRRKEQEHIRMMKQIEIDEQNRRWASQEQFDAVPKRESQVPLQRIKSQVDRIDDIQRVPHNIPSEPESAGRYRKPQIAVGLKPKVYQPTKDRISQQKVNKIKDSFYDDGADRRPSWARDRIKNEAKILQRQIEEKRMRQIAGNDINIEDVRNFQQQRIREVEQSYIDALNADKQTGSNSDSDFNDAAPARFYDGDRQVDLPVANDAESAMRRVDRIKRMIINKIGSDNYEQLRKEMLDEAQPDVIKRTDIVSQMLMQQLIVLEENIQK